MAEIIVKGRLASSVAFWRDIGASNFVIDLISNGYKIPFVSVPPRMELRNNKSALSQVDFVRNAVSELVKKGLVVECAHPPSVVNPLSVSIQSSGKKRLILDLSIVNRYVYRQSVKYEDWKCALEYISTNDWLIKFDIHSAYHHIDIFGPHTDFLGFSWSDSCGKPHYYKFLVLPFGLTSAPYVFTKVTRQLVKKWRFEGKKIVTFLDDGIMSAPSVTDAVNVGQSVKSDLIHSGFVPKVEKSLWHPSQSLEWLGFHIHTASMTVSVPERKVLKLVCSIQQLLNNIAGLHRVRSVASVVGQIVSMKLVLGSLCQLMTRSLSIDIVCASSWNSKLPLSSQSVNQLRFWKDNITSLNSRILNTSSLGSTLIFSDASDTGFGGYCVELGGAKSHGQWSSDEASRSSTWRELKAVDLVLESFMPSLKSTRIIWFTDNQNVASIVTKGSMKQHLQDVALHIFELCLVHHVHLTIQWIPRAENQVADMLSRVTDYDDWAIARNVFLQIDSKWGPHDVDRFASYYNTKLTRFNSRFYNPGCEAVDCFTVKWSGISWGVPPICLIPRTIRHMSECGARDVFTCTYGDELEEMPDGVRELAAGLPGLLSHCRADSTSRKYRYGFEAWKRWAVSCSMSIKLPISPLHCSLYLLSVIQQSDSVSAVQTAFYSIRHAHASIGIVSPTDSSLVKNVFEAAKRKLAKSVCRKEPVTIELLEKVYDAKMCQPSLADLRIVTMCLLAYSGFLRSAELLNIARCDIVFYDTHMMLFIEKSKTDVYRDGSWLVIGKTSSKLCPVSCLLKYLDQADIPPEADEFIFRNVSKTKVGYRLRKDNSPMSYTRLRELFIETFKPFVSDIKLYGLHSLRSGGASAAANNGVPDRMFKRHGRWKSENAKDGYVKDSLNSRLKVSLSLGL